MVAKTDHGRLFVPLSTEPYQWFRSGKKQWELRRYGRQYTERHVVTGRTVELRRGYQDGRSALWGKIGEVVLAPSLSAFFDRVPYQDVIPTSKSRDEAIRIASEILGADAGDIRVLGFRVIL